MATITIVRLAHLAVRTQDPAGLRAHFAGVLGLWEYAQDEDGRVHLSVDGLGGTLEIIASDDPGLDHVAWEVAAGVREDELLAALADAGVDAAPLSRVDAGTTGGVSLHDPDGTELHLVIPQPGRAPRISGTGIAPIKLGHVAVTTADPAALRRFYETTLGFRWSDTVEDMFEFLRHGADHHSLNLVRHAHSGLLQHTAFELLDWAHVQRSTDLLAAERIPVMWGPGRHGAGSNIFTYHGTGLGTVEFYTEMDRMSHPDQGFFDPRPWHVNQPQAPRFWKFSDFASMNAWGAGVPDAMREGLMLGAVQA